MKLIATIILSLTILFSQAQRCGSGIYSVKFFVPNGTVLPEINYELAPITIDDIREIVSKSQLPPVSKENILQSIHGGKVLDPRFLAVDSLFAVRRKSSLKEVLSNDNLYERIKTVSKRKGISPVRSPGFVRSSSLHFPSFETFYQLFLLRVSYNNRAQYIVGNFFGGCNHEFYLFWTESGGFRQFSEAY